MPGLFSRHVIHARLYCMWGFQRQGRLEKGITLKERKKKKAPEKILQRVDEGTMQG